MTFGELAQLIVALAAVHRASGAVIGLVAAAVIGAQRLRRRLDREAF
jgi:hypothetical protein